MRNKEKVIKKRKKEEKTFLHRSSGDLKEKFGVLGGEGGKNGKTVTKSPKQEIMNFGWPETSEHLQIMSTHVEGKKCEIPKKPPERNCQQKKGGTKG